MTECEVMLAVVIAAVVLLGSVLAVFACCKAAGDCSRQEEKEDSQTK